MSFLYGAFTIGWNFIPILKAAIKPCWVEFILPQVHCFYLQLIHSFPQCTGHIWLAVHGWLDVFLGNKDALCPKIFALIYVLWHSIFNLSIIADITWFTECSIAFNSKNKHSCNIYALFKYINQVTLEIFHDILTLPKSTEKYWLQQDLNSHLWYTSPPLYLLSYQVHRDWRRVFIQLKCTRYSRNKLNTTCPLMDKC